MLSVRLVSLALVAGCASSSAITEHEAPRGSRARVKLAPLVADAIIRLVPQAIEPMLPSADRLANVIAARLGERATVDVRYCVSPKGRIVSAELSRGSTLPYFDHAVMTDIIRWKFVTQPGPAHVRNCQAATIVYYPRA